jgi:EmrB/QacA subfamily drug resistance transporter
VNLSSQPAPGSAPIPAGPPELNPRRWLSLAVLLMGLFMSLLDTTIVNVALPTIRVSLHANEATLAWIVSGYAMAFGIALIPSGRVGDRFGHKWIFVTGLVIFTLSSVACGLSQNSTELVVARIIQGLGGGIFFPAVTALIQIMFPPREMGRAIGLLGVTIGLSVALGPLTGGLLIQAFGSTDGWRSIFFVNLPVGVITVAAALAVLPGTALAKKLSTDLFGLLLATCALAALLVPLIEGQEEGWPLWTYLSMAGAVVLFVLFALWERRVARGTAEPLVPPHLFSHLSFTGGVSLSLVYFASFSGIFYTVSLLWQAGLRHSALASGLTTVPFSVGVIVGSSQSGRLVQRLGRTTLSIGTGLLAAGLIVLWIVIRAVPTPELVNWDLLGPLFVIGLGSGFFISPNVRFIIATVPRAEVGGASGVNGTMQRIGAAIGIAVVSSVLFGTLPATFIPGKAQVAQITREYLQAGPAAIKQAITNLAYHNLAVAYGHSAADALLVSVGLAVAAFLLVFALPRQVALPGPPPAARGVVREPGPVEESKS